MPQNYFRKKRNCIYYGGYKGITEGDAYKICRRPLGYKLKQQKIKHSSRDDKIQTFRS